MSFDFVLLRPRLLISAGFGILVALLLSASLPIWNGALIGWCAGVVLYAGLIGWQMTRASTDQLRKTASALDDSAWVILIIALAATTASFAAIGALLYAPPSSSGSKTPDVILSAVTMVLSWLFTQIVFAVHYTHIFYGDVDGNARGGLKFGGDEDPDFWDFVYFTVSIGATAQTSDTTVTSRQMRRIVTAQAIYSFFFNTAILALAINIAAGLVAH